MTSAHVFSKCSLVVRRSIYQNPRLFTQIFAQVSVMFWCSAKIKRLLYGFRLEIPWSRNGPCVHNHNINFEVCISDEKDGIWYSGIVAYGKEYVFSQLGVESVSPVRNPDFTLRKLDNNRHIWRGVLKRKRSPSHFQKRQAKHASLLIDRNNTW